MAIAPAQRPRARDICESIGPVGDREYRRQDVRPDGEALRSSGSANATQPKHYETPEQLLVSESQNEPSSSSHPRDRAPVPLAES
jgi:hypothetical protein